MRVRSFANRLLRKIASYRSCFLVVIVSSSQSSKSIIWSETNLRKHAPFKLFRHAMAKVTIRGHFLVVIQFVTFSQKWSYSASANKAARLVRAWSLFVFLGGVWPHVSRADSEVNLSRRSGLNPTLWRCGFFFWFVFFLRLFISPWLLSHALDATSTKDTEVGVISWYELHLTGAWIWIIESMDTWNKRGFIL